jgi:hypothetical protein
LDRFPGRLRLLDPIRVLFVQQIVQKLYSLVLGEDSSSSRKDGLFPHVMSVVLGAHSTFSYSFPVKLMMFFYVNFL